MLRAHSVVIALIRDVASVANVIARRDGELAKQLRSALSCVALNIAEASDQRGARRDLHYSIALWSRFDEVIGTLVRVTHPR